MLKYCDWKECSLNMALDYVKKHPHPPTNSKKDYARRYAAFEVILWHLAGVSDTIEALTFFGHGPTANISREEFFDFFIHYKSGMAQNDIDEIGLRLRLGEEVTAAKYRAFKEKLINSAPVMQTMEGADGMMFCPQSILEEVIQDAWQQYPDEAHDEFDIVLGIDGQISTNKRQKLEIATLKCANVGSVADAMSPSGPLDVALLQ